MPKFQIEANGKRYEIEAPDAQTAAQAAKGALTPNQRIAGAFDASQSVHQSDGLVEPRSGLLTDRNRFGEVSLGGLAGSALGAAKSALTLPGDVYQGKVDPRSDEAIARSAELATLASPASAAMRAGERMIPGVAQAMLQVDQAMRREPKPVPTTEQLRTAGAEGFDRARNMGVDYRSEAVAQVAAGARVGLESDGILPVLAPKSFSILKQLETPPANSLAQLSGIHAARRALNNAARDFTNPTEQLAAKRIIEDLDRFVENPPAAGVMAGPAAAAGAAQKEAMENYAAAMRSKQLAGKKDIAELSAGASNSGANIDNALRQRVRDILKSPKESAGFTKEELKDMRNFVLGDRKRNATRRIANLLGGGGGLGSLVTAMGAGAAGGATGGLGAGAVAGLAIPLTGYGAKRAANSMARKGMDSLAETTRMRSPLYQNAPRPPAQIVSPEKRAALLRAMLLGQQGGGGY